MTHHTRDFKSEELIAHLTGASGRAIILEEEELDEYEEPTPKEAFIQMLDDGLIYKVLYTESSYVKDTITAEDQTSETYYKNSRIKLKKTTDYLLTPAKKKNIDLEVIEASALIADNVEVGLGELVKFDTKLFSGFLDNAEYALLDNNSKLRLEVMREFMSDIEQLQEDFKNK